MDMVRLTVVRNEIEAEQVRSLLRFEAIESVQRLTNFAVASSDGLPGMFGPREILVRPNDLERARGLLVESE